MCLEERVGESREERRRDAPRRRAASADTPYPRAPRPRKSFERISNSDVTATAPAFGRVVRTAGSVSTTSTSFVDLTGASITLTTGAFPVHLSFAASWYNDTDNQAIYINADIDGALELGTNGIIKNDTFGQEANASFSLDSAALTAASHTFKIKFKVGGGTGVITGSSANAYNFSVHEIR